MFVRTHVCMYVCMYVFMYVRMYEEREITWPGEGPNPMQLRVAQGAALSSYTARRGADRIGGRCRACSHRHAQLPVGRDPREGGGPRASAPTEAVGGAPCGARSACSGAETGVGTPCEIAHRCHRWRSLWGTIRVRGVPKYMEGRHATPPVGAVGGAPLGRDPCEGCAEMSVGTPCESYLWAVG